MASACLTAWIIAKLSDVQTAKSALYYFAPVGEKEEFVERALRNIIPYLTYNVKNGIWSKET
jgi:hypothetical protein